MQYRFTARKKDNGWQLLLRYKDGSGKWKQKSKQGYDRKSEALSETAKKALLNKVNLSTDSEDADMTLKELYRQFRKDKAKELTYSTLKVYDLTMKHFSALSDYKVSDIQYQDLMNVINALPNSSSTINLDIMKLKVLFKYAKKVLKIINADPTENIERLKERRKSAAFALTASQLTALLDSMRENERIDTYTMCAIAGYAGLRFGEISGLTAEDIDFDNNVIHVNKQYGLIGKNIYAFKPAKSNNGFRDVPIPPVLKDILKEYMQAPVSSPLDGRLFIVHDPSSINFKLKRYMECLSIHKLRHTYATLLLAHGVDIKTVSALLGDTVDTAIKTYVHYTDDMRRKAADKVADIFG